MTKKVFIIGGPNLGRLGQREPDIYGDTTWAQLESLCGQWSAELGFAAEFLQTDMEGELVGMIHQASDTADGIILNAAAYTHTSVAIRDAVAAADIPVVELHLTNPDVVPYIKNHGSVGFQRESRKPRDGFPSIFGARNRTEGSTAGDIGSPSNSQSSVRTSVGVEKR